MNLLFKVFAAGGTIDKVYFDAMSRYEVGPPQAERILREAGVRGAWEVESVLRKDSLELTDEDRAVLRERIAAAAARHIVLTHGTDTMVTTALALRGIPDKTIVLTGAMQPALFAESDAVFNLGMAIGAAQSLPPGVYIAFQGRIFDPARTRKNREQQCFEET